MIEGLLQMSEMGVVVILAVLLLRLCLRRVPKNFSYALWAIVLFRLLCPVSVTLPVSVFNLFAGVGTETDVTGQIPPRSEPGNGQAALIEQKSRQQTTKKQSPVNGQAGSQVVSEVSQERADDGWKGICTAVWLVGAVGMIAYGAFDMVRLHRKIRGASPDRENIYLLDGIASPFVAGVVRPRIYLPYGLSEQEREYVLLHEKIHIRRGDPLFRLLAYFALALHWFNPFVWVAFFVSGRDMEMSCDELVLRRMGVKIKREYSNSLLVMAQGKGLVTNIFLAFGEGDTGKRIRNVLNYKKATAQAVGIGIMAVIFALVALGSNPVEPTLAEDMAGGTEEIGGAAVKERDKAADSKEMLSIDLLCQMADEGKLADCDFRKFVNGIYTPPQEDVPDYYSVSFSFKNEQGDVFVEAACQKKDAGDVMGVPDSIYLRRQWDQEALLIYSRDSQAYYRTGTPPAGEEILAFLTADFDIMKEISFEMPDGLTMEPYSANTGYLGGRLFSPKVYEGEEHTPLGWMASGMVSRFDAEYLLRWADGQISQVLSFRNHAVMTGMNQVYDLDAPAMLVSEEYDLHTPQEMYDLDQKGIAYEPTSSYWCLYIAKEGAATGYIVSLNAKNFTEEDMLSLAKTIRLADIADESVNGMMQEPEDVEDDAKGVISETVSVRSVSRSLPGIDRYVAPDGEWEDDYGDTLVFADDCKYFINYGRETMSAQEVNFSKFAEAVEQGDPVLNKSCVVEIHNDDKLVHSITLVSGRYLNGVSYVEHPGWICGEDPMLYDEYQKQYPVVRTETMDIAAAPGEETIEIRKGYRKEDGITSVDVFFRDQKDGRLLGGFSASDEGMCLCNLYAGRMDGAGDPFILEVHLENRDTHGEYRYYVYTLGEEPGTFVQTAGSSIVWEKDGPLVYDAVEMDIFLHMLDHYLADSHLLAGMEWKEDGMLGIRTEAVCDEGRFTYANCRPDCFPDPYEADTSGR